MTAPKVSAKDKTKEWTLMFYFASDNPLAPSIVSQLKALKNAGFHPDANVVARFDPHNVGTPLHTFDVNIVLKQEALAKLKALGGPKVLDTLKTPPHRLKVPAKEKIRQQLPAPDGYQIGFPSNDPYIRNLVFDRLWGDATIPNGTDGEEKKIRDLIVDKLKASVMSGLNKTEHMVRGRAGAEARRKLFSAEVKRKVENDGLINFDPPDPDAFPPAAKALKDKAASGGRAKKIRRRKASDKVSPRDALDNFLQFCAAEYPAQHYMLFILGHGLVVGNDTFLFDEHARKHSLKLKELGEVIHDFNGATEGELELIGFHSCSMSSIEVAYELQDEAKYMLASQGPEFVGSWPYTQILIRVFNDLVRKEKDIETTVTKIFDYCFKNSADFQLAGYSFDLALCDLEKLRTPDTEAHLKALTSELIGALNDTDEEGKPDEFIRGLILLSHWEAQGFDTYTDLYDFCLCLYRRCGDAPHYLSETANARLVSIQKACVRVMTALLGEGECEENHGLILTSKFAGPDYQYSHGLSVFFPWTQPANEDFWPLEYKGYKFETTGWQDFLQQYFDKTMRDPRQEEGGHNYPKNIPVPNTRPEPLPSPVKVASDGKSGDEGEDKSYAVHETSARLDDELLEAITAHTFADELTQLGHGGGGDAIGKGGGGDAIGQGGEDSCGCPPIKNYPAFTRGRRGNKKKSGGSRGKGTEQQNPTCISPSKKF